MQGSYVAYQEVLQNLEIGYDAIMDDNELVGGIRDVRVAVDSRRYSVGRPTGVGDAGVVVQDRV